MDEEQPFLKPIPCKWACVTPSSAEIQVLPHLLEGPDKWHSNDLFWSEKEKKNKVHHPVGLEPKTSQVFTPKACALPLCYNCCPIINDNLNLFFFGLRHSDQRSGIFVWIYLLRTKNFLPHASVFPDCPRKWKECLRSTAKIHFCRNLDNQERWLKILPSVPGNR